MPSSVILRRVKSSSGSSSFMLRVGMAINPLSPYIEPRPKHTRFGFATQIGSASMTDIPLLRRSPVARRHCNLAKSFDLIGDRWTLLILRSAMYGVRRFDDFQAELDVPRSVLSARLAALVDAGIVERREYREEGQRGRTEYPLTQMGSQLGLPFFAMTAWGDKWL